MEIDENEAFIFGLEIKDDWHLIGNAYIFMDAVCNLLDTVKDETPVFDSNGESKG